MVSLPGSRPGGTRLEGHEEARTHASRKTQQPRKGENYEPVPERNSQKMQVVWGPKPSPALPRRVHRLPVHRCPRLALGNTACGLRPSASTALGAANGGLRRTLATGAEMCMVAACSTADMRPHRAAACDLQGRPLSPPKRTRRATRGPTLRTTPPHQIPRMLAQRFPRLGKEVVVWVGGRNRCDSEDQPGRGLNFVFVVPGPCVFLSKSS